ncbi:MAG: mechanosensitive ion channel [Planctomycetota bacterium]|jgi:hypothetical protein
MEVIERTIQSLGGYLPRIIAAVVVLILGFLAARLISVFVLRCLRRIKLDDHVKRGIGGEYKAERWIAQAAFWLVMLMAVIAFFSVLQLPHMAGSLRIVVDEILEFLPKLLAAGLLFFIAWILAKTLRFAISKSMAKTKLDERFSEKTATPEEKGQISLSKTLANMAYWLIFLLFLPAILSALAMEGILVPVEQMVEKVVVFLPNLFVAGMILLIGWFFARVIRQVITSVLASLGTDQLAEKIGLKQSLKKVSLSRALGLVVYILILIPIVIAALDAVKLDGITQPASHMLERILDALPLVFSAIVILIIAYMVGRLVRGLAINLLESIDFNSLPAKLGLGKDAAKAKWTPSEIVGHLILVLIMLFASVSACNLLGLENLSDLFSRLLVFVGHILIGVVIFAIGLYLANLVAKIIASRDIVQAKLLAIIAKVAILLLAGAMSLRQMGLANEIISLAFGLLLGAVAVAGAIAFGIGGRDIAAQKLNEWTKSIESGEDEKPDSTSEKS